MKIIKNGKRRIGSFVFDCEICGCTFSANCNDYEYVSYFNHNTKQYKVNKEGSTSEIICICPECGNIVYKNVYNNINESSIKHFIMYLNSIIEILAVSYYITLNLNIFSVLLFTLVVGLVGLNMTANK